MARKATKKKASKVLVPEIVKDDKAGLQALQQDYRHKIDLTRLIQLRVKRVSVPDIAKVFECSERAVYLRLAEFKSDPAHVCNFRENKDNVFEFLQQELVSSFSADEIKKIPAFQRIVGMGILDDKIRLKRGESTSNIAVIDVVARNAQVMKQAEARMNEIKDKRQGKP